MGVTAFRGIDLKMKVLVSSGMHASARFRDVEVLDIESQTLSSVADYPAVSQFYKLVNIFLVIYREILADSD